MRVLASIPTQLAVMTLAILTGCASLDRAAAGAGKAVTKICEQTSQPIRDDAIARVNAAAAPHSVSLTCRASPTQ